MYARDVCALENDFRKFLHCKVRKKVYIVYLGGPKVTFFLLYTIKEGNMKIKIIIESLYMNKKSYV